MKKESVCMITGVGDGTGAFTARRFAKAGYNIAMVARDKNRLSNLENEILNSKGFTCDVQIYLNQKKLVNK